MRTQEAARGVIITTSGFMPAAIERARTHQYIARVDGSELQRLLDQHFQRGLYRVSPA
jgi:restriction endonuclease Mrr